MEMMFNDDPLTVDAETFGHALAKYFRDGTYARILAVWCGGDETRIPANGTMREVFVSAAETCDRARLLAEVRERYPLFPAQIRRPKNYHALTRALCRVANTPAHIEAKTDAIVRQERINWRGSAEAVWCDVIDEAAVQGRLDDIEAIAARGAESPR